MKMLIFIESTYNRQPSQSHYRVLTASEDLQDN